MSVDWKGLKQRKQKELGRCKYKSHLDYVQKNMDKLERNLYKSVKHQKAGTMEFYDISECMGLLEGFLWTFDFYDDHWLSSSNDAASEYVVMAIGNRLRDADITVEDGSAGWFITLP